ncbi:hypothetical protein CPB84DRAFT_1778827 [Gymnopilus junonius]|uniref:HNH nuclease domain-containing protein n=1 Tax=Gymnopilus junonius TaxID=109634 RepID=A0A9P5NNE0_GYMJU|nr:hypothetical protein CPB84DRAFT_1778827 [Gymnopilus junonius]
MPYSSSSSSSLSESLISTDPPPTTISEAAAIQDAGDLSDGLRRRVVDATSKLTMDRCLITNTTDDVRYCHVLPRTTSERVIRRLEYSWGIKYGQLNVDSSSNILRLSIDMHKSFRRTFWFLIPEDLEILQIYKQHTKRGLVDNEFANLLSAGPYRYKLIASWFMKPHSITRYEDPPDVPTAMINDISRAYSFPYDDFPTIVSHVHPRFVIYHAGYCLSKNWIDFSYPHSKIRPTFIDIRSIYKLWTQHIPKNDHYFRQHPPHDQRDINDDRSQSSDCTRVERYNWKLGKPAEPLVTPLDRSTLRAFNVLGSGQSSKDDPVSHWLSQIPTSPHDFDMDPVSGMPLDYKYF